MAKPFSVSELTEEKKIRVSTHHLAQETANETLHWHDFFEFEIVLEGDGVHNYNGRLCPLQRGDAYLMTHYDFHTVSSLTDMVILHIAFHEDTVPDDMATALLSSVGQLQCRFSEEEIAYLQERSALLEEELRSNLSFYDIIARGFLIEIISQILRKVAPAPERLRMQPQMKAATAYMQKHFRDNLLLSDVAAHIGLSTNHCGNLFRKSLGVSFHTFLLQLRLKYACQMLTASNIPISTVAEMTGFNTTEYFFMSFKKALGMTPSAYRAKTQKR